MTDDMTFSRTGDFADEKTTICDYCPGVLSFEKNDFYTSDFKRFTLLSI